MFLSNNHSKHDDCEIYLQGRIAGCNIMSRNILAYKKKNRPIREVERVSKVTKKNLF